MSFLKKFGGKKADKAASTTEDHADLIGESVAEPMAASNDAVDDGMGSPESMAEVHGDSSAMDGESVVGSTDSSAESIIVTQGEQDADFDMSGVSAPPAKKGIFAKLFGGKTKEKSMASPEVISESVEQSDDEILKLVGKRPKSLPILGRLSKKTQYTSAIGLVVLAMTSAALLAAYGFRETSNYQLRSEIATRMTMLSQRISTIAQATVVGDAQTSGRNTGVDVGYTYDHGVNRIRLAYARLELERQMANLLEGNAKLGLPAQKISEFESLGTLQEDAKAMYGKIEVISDIAPVLSLLGENAKLAEDGSSEMFYAAERLLAHMYGIGAPDVHVAGAEHIRMLSERINRNSAQLLTASSVRLQILSQLLADYDSFNDTMKKLREGDPVSGATAVTDEVALRMLDELSAPLKKLSAMMEYTKGNTEEIVKARQTLTDVLSLSDSILMNANTVSTDMAREVIKSRQFIYLSALGALVAILGILLLALIDNRVTKIEAWESAYRNKRNEQDIIDFMKDIMPLEMGDLTVRFTDNVDAMEGITGGIRSSVNEAVMSLREAVGTVKTTTTDVSDVVSRSVNSSTELNHSNERQAEEITQVVKSVAELAHAINTVTEQTINAAEVTSFTKQASEEGAAVVAKTNEKMSEIRANMQEVLKSVKHLGETSHEIGQIVETIEQITDRTQVLAVNASLEAAKAGAAGQGFQIIAGEVNRLSEQSNDALRTITALVQRIQGETGNTIRIVEDSTNNVVEGARLSEAANGELTRIATLSEQLNQIMAEIREQSQTQSANAGSVRGSMDRLVGLSSEFQKTVREMVDGVQQIESSMGSLKNTVSIFTTEAEEII